MAKRSRTGRWRACEVGLLAHLDIGMLCHSRLLPFGRVVARRVGRRCPEAVLFGSGCVSIPLFARGFQQGNAPVGQCRGRGRAILGGLGNSHGWNGESPFLGGEPVCNAVSTGAGMGYRQSGCARGVCGGPATPTRFPVDAAAARTIGIRCPGWATQIRFAQLSTMFNALQEQRGPGTSHRVCRATPAAQATRRAAG